MFYFMEKIAILISKLGTVNKSRYYKEKGAKIGKNVFIAGSVLDEKNCPFL